MARSRPFAFLRGLNGSETPAFFVPWCLGGESSFSPRRHEDTKKQSKRVIIGRQPRHSGAGRRPSYRMVPTCQKWLLPIRGGRLQADRPPVALKASINWSKYPTSSSKSRRQ
jgi:hypothetical protein